MGHRVAKNRMRRDTMIAIVLLAFAAHVIAWLVLPDTGKAPAVAADTLGLASAV